MASTTTSGTTALHLACAILDIKEGDEVIISSSTNMACAFPVDYCNAKPVPADIITNTWQVNTCLIESLINKTNKSNNGSPSLWPELSNGSCDGLSNLKSIS